MKRASLLMAVMAVGLFGCGTLCQRADRAYKSIPDKIKNCQLVADLPFNVDACETAFKADACTATDKTTVETVLSCLEKLPNCTAGQESAWQTQYQNCYNVTVSTSCNTAFDTTGG